MEVNHAVHVIGNTIIFIILYLIIVTVGHAEKERVTVIRTMTVKDYWSVVRTIVFLIMAGVEDGGTSLMIVVHHCALIRHLVELPR